MPQEESWGGLGVGCAGPRPGSVVGLLVFVGVLETEPGATHTLSEVPQGAAGWVLELSQALTSGSAIWGPPCASSEVPAHQLGFLVVTSCLRPPGARLLLLANWGGLRACWLALDPTPGFLTIQKHPAVKGALGPWTPHHGPPRWQLWALAVCLLHIVNNPTRGWELGRQGAGRTGSGRQSREKGSQSPAGTWTFSRSASTDLDRRMRLLWASLLCWALPPPAQGKAHSPLYLRVSKGQLQTGECGGCVAGGGGQERGPHPPASPHQPWDSPAGPGD
ncbi:Hypothetical predicted protein [Marmota monax]|uniref:Uncharacterized protein n=1 Tax=Marmota monax TaxID=9995 RepID=A0A5E4CUB6_MARMO|nr:hypothetical protein GHT09_016440 [Marmota monax]VTJ85406.1 Hypothetical predicted protein [Marmota monax]